MRNQVGSEIMSAWRLPQPSRAVQDRRLPAGHPCPLPLAGGWDDHEVDNNYAGDISEHADVTNAQLLIRRANGYQAFYEHMPLRRTALPRGANMQFYRNGLMAGWSTSRCSTPVSIAAISPMATGSSRWPPVPLDPKQTMLGDKQDRWLMNNLLDSTALWNVLGQQVMMARVDGKPGDGQEFGMDIWSGYDVRATGCWGSLLSGACPMPWC